MPVASHLLPSKQVVVDLKEKKPQKCWLIILMSLKTHSQQFSCTTAKDKDTGGQVIPISDTWYTHTFVKFHQTLLEFANTAIATCAGNVS